MKIQVARDTYTDKWNKMKYTIITGLLLCFSNMIFGQTLISGDYDFGLKLAYDNTTHQLTGYFENYTGWDEETNNAKFSCIFYIEGKAAGKKFKINTYYPLYKLDDQIEGDIEIVDHENVTIKLPEEHGGCWNVQHFADKPEAFSLEKKAAWLQVRYVTADRSYFFKESNTGTKLKSYLVKGDFVCIERIEKERAYCTYFGKKVSKGWLTLKDLNVL
jgi:hypothetical protein